jgi:hypothetical protein
MEREREMERERDTESTVQCTCFRPAQHLADRRAKQLRHLLRSGMARGRNELVSQTQQETEVRNTQQEPARQEPFL